ncbi:hypothetical protein F4811DRAFT_525613 [Daldinia bambusicola]|nr:hypothetical protein F4811DRAFT_525613 [Daldinia bambusicola]
MQRELFQPTILIFLRLVICLLLDYPRVLYSYTWLLCVTTLGWPISLARPKSSLGRLEALYDIVRAGALDAKSSIAYNLDLKYAHFAIYVYLVRKVF